MNASVNSTVIDGSMINVWMDETNPQIVMAIKGQLLAAYQNMTPALIKAGWYEPILIFQCHLLGFL